MTDHHLRDYKDPSTITKWLKGLSYLGIAASIMAVFADYVEYDYLHNLSEGFFRSKELALEAEDYKENLLGIAGIFQLILIAQIILWFVWIYRLNKNTRALHPNIKMKFTPGWAVGWFFIPVANLWKPYQVLKELWWANHAPNLAESGKVNNGLVGVFWSIFLISTALSKLSFKKSIFAEELPDLIIANKVTLISDIADIPYYILTIILVRQLYQLHKNLPTTNVP